MTCSVLLLHRYPETKHNSCTTTVFRGRILHSHPARCNNYNKADSTFCLPFVVSLIHPYPPPVVQRAVLFLGKRTIIPPGVQRVSQRLFHWFQSPFVISRVFTEMHGSGSSSIIFIEWRGGQRRVQHTVLMAIYILASQKVSPWNFVSPFSSSSSSSPVRFSKTWALESV